MRRATLPLLLGLVAPAAGAWVPCNAPGIEAPVPIEREPPAYPDAVRATGIEGTVEVALTVLRDGRVGWVRVVRSAPEGYFESAAVEGVRRWCFKPARRDGEPVECRLTTRVRFALSDEVTTSAVTDGSRPQPAYPPELLRQRIEGYVEVEYEVDATGAVQDARVTAAMPRGAFEQAALAAVRAWRDPAPAGMPRSAKRRARYPRVTSRSDSATVPNDSAPCSASPARSAATAARVWSASPRRPARSRSSALGGGSSDAASRAAAGA